MWSIYASHKKVIYECKKCIKPEKWCHEDNDQSHGQRKWTTLKKYGSALLFYLQQQGEQIGNALLLISLPLTNSLWTGFSDISNILITCCRVFHTQLQFVIIPVKMLYVTSLFGLGTWHGCAHKTLLLVLPTFAIMLLLCC